jgi:putative CocE/NonD family hydrolase
MKKLFTIFTLLVFLFPAFLGAYDYENQNIVREEIKIPLRDGVKLGATLYRPMKEGKYPALVLRTPYSKDGYDSRLTFPLKAAKEGYIVFLVDVRGRYTSEGEFRAYHNEKQDGYDVIEWVGTSPNCNGKVGTFGISYRGIVQWLALSQDPPHLKAAAPHNTPISSHHFFYVGGGFSLPWYDWFITNIFPDKRKRANDKTGSWDGDEAEKQWNQEKRRWYQYRPLVEMPLLKKYAPEYYGWLTHPDKTEWWDFVSVDHEISKMKAPVFLSSGWYDSVYGTVGATEGFNRMRKDAGSEIARTHTRLILGPWNHTVPTLQKRQFGDVDFGPAAAVDFEEEHLRFFDCELKEICDNQSKPVDIFIMGENRWRSESEWPLSRTVQTSYYISGDQGLQTKPAENERSSQYTFDPKNPLWDVNFENQVPYDQKSNEARSDVLVYTSQALTEDVEVTGEIAAELFVSSSARDTDFAIIINDVHPDGKSINVHGFDSGFLRMRYRNGFEKQELMKPGEIYKIRIGQMYTSNMFKKGHRIRVVITSSKAPHYDPNPNTGTEIATESKLESATQTIYFGKNHPSRVILPVIPR